MTFVPPADAPASSVTTERVDNAAHRAEQNAKLAIRNHGALSKRVETAESSGKSGNPSTGLRFRWANPPSTERRSTRSLASLASLPRLIGFSTLAIGFMPLFWYGQTGGLTRILNSRGMGLVGPAVVDTATEANTMEAQDLHRRGSELRAALQETYERLAASHELRGGLHGTDVTDIVLKFVPIGSTFQFAERILRIAGFTIGPQPGPSPPGPNRPKDWYAVIAKIAPFFEKFPTRVDLYISLLPPSPGEYTTVSGLRAQFFVATP